MLHALAILLGLIVWGAHPLAAIRSSERDSRRAALWALPLAVAAATVLAASTARQPDAALTVGLGPGWPAFTEGQVAALLLVLGLAADAVALLFRGRNDTAARPLRAAIGFAPLAGFALWTELLRLGQGPGSTVGAFWCAVLLRTVVGLGPGELLLPGRPRAATISAIALLLYPLALPTVVSRALESGGDLPTLLAAATLLLAAGRLPARLGRVALAAAAILAALFLARTAEISQLLQEVPPIQFVVPES